MVITSIFQVETEQEVKTLAPCTQLMGWNRDRDPGRLTLGPQATSTTIRFLTDTSRSPFQGLAHTGNIPGPSECWTTKRHSQTGRQTTAPWAKMKSLELVLCVCSGRAQSSCQAHLPRSGTCSESPAKLWGPAPAEPDALPGAGRVLPGVAPRE